MASKVYKTPNGYVRGIPWVPERGERVYLMRGEKLLEGIVVIVYPNGSPDEPRPSATVQDDNGAYWSGLFTNLHPVEALS